MRDHQRDFIELALRQGVLQFGEFRLKSGRLSPYFFNAGRFDTGSALARLGRAYAQTILDWDERFDLLFGPAYKGIPLAAVTAAALFEQAGVDLPYAFNRKEAKDHGEGGNFVGHAVEGRVLILDDVITAGTAIRESVAMLKAQHAEPAGVVIALDRQERGAQRLSAVQEVRQQFRMPVRSIICLDDLIDYVANDPAQHGHLDAIRAYRAEYGVERDPG